uniref:Ig-like domain-containing protein n=1 Tax=Hucho hucho TaxID=62062 RepID=A0A4W5PQ06_9TELE
MQENNVNQPTSLSQLLRENYLAEAWGHQRHSAMSRSDSSSRHLFYAPLKGKAEDSAGQDEPQPQFPDLSAFLSQEELDKSVNLACHAIGHKAREERTEFKAPVAPSRLSFSPLPKQDNMIRIDKQIYQGMNTPAYGLGTQSKKEFLNKAADFIEELSSLFKANSSKRIRPRSCKTHRCRANKGQVDGSVYSQNADDRERTILLQNFEIEMGRPANPFSIQPPEVQDLGMEPGFGHAYFPMQDWRTTEEQYDDSGVLEADGVDKAESPAMVEITPGVYTADPICEPPHFLQKLKSREVLEGSKVQLDCVVRGLPMPEVRWFCEGKELENCPDIQIINNGELHSLIIAEAFEEDTGRYSCFASNFYGTDSTSAEIYVEDSYTLSLDIFPQGLDGRPIMAAPVFTKSLQDLLASESQLVVLECRVKGVPFPKVDWYREGTVIEDSPDFRILQKKPRSMAESEEICTLVIAEVFPEDSGTFTCTASNKYGTVSSIAALRVKGNVTGLQTKFRLDSSIRTAIHKPEPPPHVNLPDPPNSSCLKPGVLVNHNGPRSSSRAGLRVHFKLPEDETENQSEASNSHSYEDMSQLANKEPPPVLAKPKL